MGQMSPNTAPYGKLRREVNLQLLLQAPRDGLILFFLIDSFTAFRFYTYKIASL